MIKNVIPIPDDEFHEWCDHCKKGPDMKNIRNFYFVESTNRKMNTMVLCNCCLDLALNETGILPEEF
jgi:hypothetical protein